MGAVRVIVVGAGLGGLAAACHLAGRGHDVLVLERAGVPGGRAGLWEPEADVAGREARPGGSYRFDTGPVVLTMVDIVAATFAAAGANLSDYLDLRPVDPMYRACFADGSELRVRHGREAMTAEIRDVCGPGEAAAFGRFCDWLTDLAHLELPTFIDRNFDSPLDLTRSLGPLVRLARMGGLRKLAAVVESYFSDHRLQKVFSFQSMYAGLSPFDALAVFCIITYMDTVAGVYFPMGGIHALARGLAAAAEKAGACLRYSQTVTEVLRRPGARRGCDGGVAGVRLVDGEVVEAPVVVLNPDLPVAYRHLLPGLPAPRVARRGQYSPSCVLWLAGVRGSLPTGAAHHNIHFGREWKGAFRALLDRGARMADPSILVTSPSFSDPSLAPSGHSSLYVLEPVPNLDAGLDWVHERSRLRDDLARRVSALGYPTEVEVERLYDPIDWQRQGMERGTPFALAHRFFQSGPFRPTNVDPRVPGLVFVGSGTQPGVGIPMVLLSGRLAAERVEAMTPMRTR